MFIREGLHYAAYCPLGTRHGVINDVDEHNVSKFEILSLLLLFLVVSDILQKLPRPASPKFVSQILDPSLPRARVSSVKRSWRQVNTALQ